MDLQMWAVVNRNGAIMAATIHSRKSGAIKALIGEGMAPSRPWRWWREKYGLKALRVRVSVETDQQKGAQS